MNEDWETPLTGDEQQLRNWAAALHISQLAGYLTFGLGLVAPIAIWLIQRKEMPRIDPHGRVVANWLISFGIYGVIGAILTVLFAVTIVLIPLIWVMWAVYSGVAVVFPIIGAYKAMNGEVWPYPMSIRFFEDDISPRQLP